MSEYKIGDAVRVENREDRDYGMEGVVVDVQLDGILVELSDDEMPLWFAPDVLAAAISAPDVVQYPADGHPDHYTAGLPEGVAAVDVIKAHLKAGGTWDTANALKYLIRHPLKENPTQDIKKAIRCLNMWVAEQEAA